MRPYAPGTEIPPEYGDTKVARSTAIEAAAVAGVDGWRAVGNAKARVEDQDIVADHANASLRSLILLEPGPKLRFGDLSLAGYKRMRPDRLAEIAGFPTGRVFNPDDLAAVERRLRRSGVFRTIALTEAEIPNPDGTLDISLLVEEEALRRFGFGAEIASFEGLSVNGFWLHRNLLGGGERLRFDAAAGGIEGQSGGIDYDVSVRFERPATFSADNTLFSEARAERIDDADFDADRFEIGIGMTRFFGERLEAEVKLSYVESHVDDGGGSIDYRQIALPAKLSYDQRDVALDATEGYFAMAEIKPFLGFGSTGDGVRLFGDGRIYRGFGTDDGVVLAARLQVGTVTGPTLLGTPREDLFYSGGGGTVRGQPYQSLGVRLLRGGSVGSGGQSFVGASGEVRFDVSERIGLVGFADIGGVSPLDFFSGGVEWHSGAGIGVRYATPIGPIRLDVAAPVSGTTGDGVQIYIGIGQSF
jgi:translocation and assembly module TamA